MNPSIHRALSIAFVLAACAGEAPDASEPIEGPPPVTLPTSDAAFVQFMERHVADGPEPGTYIVERDILLRGDVELFAYYDHHVNGAPMRIGRLRSPFEADDPTSPWFSSVRSSGGKDQVWAPTDKLELTYCISDDFDDDYDRVVDTFVIATNDWERATHVNFIHRPEYDHMCDRAAISTDVVRFTVEPVANNPDWIGYAFFPSSPPEDWKIRITGEGLDLTTGPFRGLIRHELGHTLGLVHEHIHDDCTDETTSGKRATTPLDRASIMYYSSCPLAAGSNNELTRLDVLGVRQLYTLPTHKWTARYGGLGGGQVEFPMQTDFNGDGITDILFQGLNVSDLYYGHQGQVVFGSVPYPIFAFEDMRPIPGLFSNTAGWTHDIMSYRHGSSSDYLQLSTSPAPVFTKHLRSIDGIYMPLAGQFSGGYTDILWYRPGTGSDHLWIMQGDGSHVDASVNINGHYIPLVGNFNGDEYTDIFWYNPMSANSPFWPSQGGGNFGSNIIPNTGLDATGQPYIPIVGDFTGDGSDDIMWYRKGSASDRLWVSNGYLPSGSTLHKSVQGDYKPFIGDFDGDGAQDIFWYSPGGGSEVIWFFDSNGNHSTVLVDDVNGDYAPFVGDFDNDGDDDIVWYRPEHTWSPVWESLGNGDFTALSLTTPQSHYPVGYGPSN